MIIAAERAEGASSNINRILRRMYRRGNKFSNSSLLPECIAFNQSAFCQFLPECIVPRTTQECHAMELSSFFVLIPVRNLQESFPVLGSFAI